MRRPKLYLAVLCLALTIHCPTSARSAEWSRDFRLKEYMRIYDFPEELVSYPVVFPPKTVRRSGLTLTALHTNTPHPVVFQLSKVVERDAFLQQATVSFRSDLPKGSTRRFRLTYSDKPVKPLDKKSVPHVGITNKQNGTAILAANLLRVRVPFGRQSFQKPIPFAKAPAPILAIARHPKVNSWCLAGSLRANDSLKVIDVNAAPIDEGPLFAKYRIAYTFDKGQQYTVELTLRHNEKYVTVDEYLGGIQPQNEAYLRIDLTPGVDPDQREVMSNGGYGAQGYCGAYDKNTDESGKLPFELGLNRPNSMGVMRAAAFYKDKGEHSLLFCLYRLRDWKTVYRHVWYSNTGPGNLNFYARGSGAGGAEKFLLTRLEGRERHWAIGLIPRDEQRHVRNTPGNKGRGPAGGPEVRLWQKLADFSLDRVKDWVFEWDESLDAKLFPEGNKVTYDQWVKGNGLNSSWWFLNAIVNFYWDFSAEVGPPSFGFMPAYFGEYERSRTDWTEEQRRHVRAILLFYAYTAEDDNNLPHHSMLAGQPNFVMQVKQTIAIACGVFPKHPHAKRWRDSFVKFYEEWLQAYGRQADPEHNALGGRWTENIACYSGTSLQASLRCAKGLDIFDKTDLLKQPVLHDWVRWYLNAFMSPHNGQRRVPPEGAHAGAFAVGGAYWNSLFEIARLIEPTAPELSKQMRWIETNGKQGIRPKLESVLIRDYGPVLRYDFGAPREAYLHLMQTSGRYNYRWGSGSGVLYYGAKNKNWSYNGAETNGDAFDINQITSFSVGGNSLGYHPTAQPLYAFDFAQFYRAVADRSYADKTKYRSRGLMMLRDDYIAVFDDVDGQTEGQFTWMSGGQLPQIYQLKPGVEFDKSSNDQVRRFRGRGDFLTLVAPTKLKAQSTPYGAVVNDREHIFCRDDAFKHSEAGIRFQGTVGYARPEQLALFEGTELSFHGLTVRRRGGDFGVSATVSGKGIVGRIAGRRGGHVEITPRGIDVKQAKVTIEGHRVEAIIKDGSIGFDISTRLRDGYKRYRISF